MSSKGSRHRKKGPGGPSRPARSGRTTPPSHRHRPDLSGVLDPTLRQVVRTLLETAHRAAPPDHPGRAPALELWAGKLAVSSYEDGAMPRDFYVDLARALQAADDPLAPAVLAALALAVDHRDAAALRQARSEWLALTLDPDPSDLGIGRARPVDAVVLDVPGESQVSLVVGITQGLGRHSLGVLVDDDLGGAGRDLWVGPPLDEVVARARAEGDLVITPLTVADAVARAIAAIDLALADDILDADDHEVLPLVLRRLDPDPG